MHFIYPFIASLALSHRALDYQLTPNEYVRALFHEKNSPNNPHHIVSLIPSSTKMVFSPLITLKQILTRAWCAMSTPQQVLLSGTQFVANKRLKYNAH